MNCAKDSVLTEPRQKNIADNRNGSKYNIFLFSYYFIFSTLHVSLMLLIMTMNGWVIIAILIGSTIGYYLNAKNQPKDKS